MMDPLDGIKGRLVAKLLPETSRYADMAWLIGEVERLRMRRCQSCVRWRPVNDIGTRGHCAKWDCQVPSQHGCLAWEA